MALSDAIFFNLHENIELLITNKNEINKRNAFGNTPLMSAVSKNNFGLVARLVKSGAILDMRDLTGETAFFKAFVNGYVQIASYLCKNGASIFIPDFNNTNPIMYRLDLYKAFSKLGMNTTELDSIMSTTRYLINEISISSKNGRNIIKGTDKLFCQDSGCHSIIRN